MGQGQAVGMEHEAALGLGVIEGIAQDGMAVVGQVDPDLVGAAGFQLAVDQAGSC